MAEYRLEVFSVPAKWTGEAFVKARSKKEALEKYKQGEICATKVIDVEVEWPDDDEVSEDDFERVKK